MAIDAGRAAEAAPYVLLEKATPERVLTPQSGAPDTRQSPLNTRGFNSVLVDVVPGPASTATTVTVLGAPTPGGPWLQEVDPQAFQSGVAAARRFVVTGTSAYVAVALSNPRDWTVWLTPFNAASQTNVTIQGTTSNNVAQYGGVAVGPANPVDVRLGGTSAVTASEADGANVALGALADAAVTTNAAGTALGKLRGLVALLAAAVSITFGWLRVQVQPSTWSLNGTSGANAAQTVTQAAAGAGVRNYLNGLTVSWSGGAPAAGTNVVVKDGSTTIWDQYLGAAGATQGSIDFEFSAPLTSSANAALAVTVAAAGAAVTTKVSAQGTTGP